MSCPRGRRAPVHLLVAGALNALLIACGGGGGGSTPPPSLTILTTSLPDATMNRTYNQTVQASGGAGSLTWSLSSGSLPIGLTLASTTGVISGTPTTNGSSSFTVQVRDSSNPPRTATQTLTIRVGSPLGITTTSLPDGSLTVTYNQTLNATGGTTPVSFSVASGNLPPGLTLSPAGVLSGTPTQTGLFTFLVTAQDSASPPRTANRALLIRVFGALAIATTSLPSATVQSSYSAALIATGGVPPRIWNISSGVAAFTAAGLTLNPSTGLISGTLSNSPGPVNFTVQVTDSRIPTPAMATMAFTVNIASSLGRNDFIANATPLSNGTYAASISPLVDPPGSTVANPDIDVYKLTASGGAIVSVEITAQRLTPSSSLDSVIEITDGIGPDPGSRLTTCRSPSSTTGLFNEPCMNDDIGPGITDSRLEFQVPGSGPQTFFVRVLDFRGDARPDFIYTITINGAN